MVDIPGNASTSAKISVGETTTNSLETIGDHDWFAITLTAGQSITITMTGTGLDPLVDSYLRIRDAAGNELAFNDDGAGNRNAQLNFTAATSGTYYIDASSWSNVAAGYPGYTGTYQLSVVPYTPPPLFDYDQIADQLVNGYWESVGGSARHFNVTEGGTITVNLTELNLSEKILAREALALWSDSLGITFTETALRAQINFHNNDGDPSEDSAFSSSVTAGGLITSSDITIDTAWVDYYGASLNSYSFQTYLHEIGHALGLGHAGNYNGSADYMQDALYQNDAWSTTVMSYFSQAQNSYFANQAFTYDYIVTPMVGDLVAMAILYGTPTTTRTGNTTYGFNSTAGREVFNASSNPDVAYTIIDSGGIDTLDYSQFANDQVINLNAESFSNVGAGVGNVSIARGTVIENAIGGSGDDMLIGNASNNVLTGNAGNDILNGGAGNDSLNGGAGIDMAVYSGASSAVVVNLALTGAQNTRGGGIDTLVSIEQVMGSAFGDQLNGNSGDNLLIGGGGNDRLFGEAGNDTIDAGDGNDTIDGGSGNDRIFGGNGSDYLLYTTATAAVHVDLSITVAQDTGGSGMDQIQGVERVYGSRYGDVLTGDGVANLLRGMSGDDVIHGGGGSDDLQGDDGNDTLIGGIGNDVLRGGVGNDILDGGDGIDRLYDRGGNDVLSGGAGRDLLYYTDAASGVTVDLSRTGAQDTGGAGIDTISGIEWLFGSRFGDTLTGSSGADRLLGQAGDDILRGGAGDDIVQGDAGNDVISGGTGNDALYGGTGMDTFRFDTALNASTNVDTLREFNSAEDGFELDQSVFSAIAAGALADSAFHIGTQAADASDRIIYDQARGTLFYDADGSGAGEQVLFARLTAGTVVTSADFFVAASAQAAAEAPLMKSALSVMSPLDEGKAAPAFQHALDDTAWAPEPVHFALFTDTAHSDQVML